MSENVDNIVIKKNFVERLEVKVMKWLKQAILVILILSTVFESYPQSMLIKMGNSNNLPGAKIVDKIYSSDEKYLKINVIIPQIKNLTNEEKESAINMSISKWTEEWINDVKVIADEYFKDNTVPIYPYQVSAQYKVTSLKNIISFYIDYYQYTGGAHGITTRKAYNIDEKTGQLLTLKDLFAEEYNYKDIIDSYINNEINKNKDYYFTGKEGFNGIDDKTKFYIDGESLVIYYGQYEIAPYVAGMPEFRIPINTFKEMFKYDNI